MKFDPNLIRSLAKKFHTPYYLFDEATIRRQCQILKNAIPYKRKVIRYACKALTISSILKIIRDEGLKIDAVSINEVHRALLAGFNTDEILYTGEGASRLVYEELLAKDILINCSSIDQIRLIGEIKAGSKCSVRFNPGEGHGANNKINTGGPSSKHGIYFTQLNEVKEVIKNFNLNLVGIHSHIGSGTDLAAWLRIKDLTLNIARQFSTLTFIDLGGGLPVVYNSETDKPMPINEWGRELTNSFEQFSREYGREVELQVEPGKFIVAECGKLVAEVQTLKHTPDYNFIVVNTGLNHNIRPALYGAYHPIDFVAADDRALSGKANYVIAGYLCESGDVFTVAADGTLLPREFPLLKLGDLMVMGNVGAYSHSMKSEYNSMNLPPSILLQSDGQCRLIERRGNLNDLMRRETEIY